VIGGSAVVVSAGIVGAAVGGAGRKATAVPVTGLSTAAEQDTLPFTGAHQAGVVTDAQRRLLFAAFDVTTGDRRRLTRMVGQWTAAAAALTSGRPIEGDNGPGIPPPDSGEVSGMAAARLTLTFGVGPSLFDGRFGLAPHRPAALRPLPGIPGDRLDSTRCDGDLCLQACAEDAQVALHAIRNLAHIARGVARIRWLQSGFLPEPDLSDAAASPRNLMGFRDGTNNIIRDDPEVMAENVWVTEEADRQWLRGGTYLVARRIRMLLETWDSTSLARQEAVFGRRRETGAPLGGVYEHDAVDLHARGRGGEPLIAADAHVRISAPANNGGIHLLRRGYSFCDGIDEQTGELDAGLFFVAFQKDPHRQFVPLQRRLARHDALSRYTRHVGSALFACPPGVREGESWAADLLNQR
jgi:deferrochelatase/peroxidase EfeB